jgi:hypothetical protein
MTFLSGYCFIVLPDYYTKSSRKEHLNKKDKALRTLELSENLHTQRNILAGRRSRGPLRIVGHKEKRRVVYDTKHNYDIFVLPGDG